MKTLQWLIVAFGLIYQAQSTCDDTPIDLNRATLAELDALPYISASSAQLIIDLRPICSPLELTTSPKKIRGITVNRLNTNWNWYSDQLCSDTCCKADAFCTSSTDVSSTTYSWQTSLWSECSALCDTGTQNRNVSCFNSTHSVNTALCASLDEPQPLNKQLCNTHKCPIYEWILSEWSVCNRSVDTSQCIQTRTVSCYETVNNTIESDEYCTDSEPFELSQTCDDSQCTKTPQTSMKSTEIDNDIIVNMDLLHEYNQQQCHTKSYRNINDSSILITRRSCFIDIWIFIDGKTDDTAIDISWFYINATLKSQTDESVGDEWNGMISWYANNRSSGWITIDFPSDSNIGEFVVNLYLQPNGNVVNDRKLISEFTLFVLFNPYSNADDVYMSSTTNRREYIENEVGLIWQGLSDINTGFVWNFDQFEFQNLKISMNLLKRLALQYRNDIVLISRQISYAVGEDICC